MRAFVAIDFAEPHQDALINLQGRLNVGRMMSSDNLHLTLAFLGEQTEQALEALHEDLEMVTQPGFALRLRGLDLFGGARTRTLAVLTEATPELSALQGFVARAARRVGITLERRKFRPHVSVVRLKDGAQSQERVQRALSLGNEVDLDPISVTGFALYRSVLTPTGAHHEILAEYPLIGLADGAG